MSGFFRYWAIRFFVLTCMAFCILTCEVQSMIETPAKASNLEISLNLFKAKFLGLAGALAQKKVDVKNLEERCFTEGGFRIPIRFDRDDMLSTYLNRYNQENSVDQIKKENCQVVGGPFTYYDAIGEQSRQFSYYLTTPQEKNISRDPSSKTVYKDMGWGCAWRASLNVINKVKEWLSQKGIKAKQDRPLIMADIKDLTGLEGGSNCWIEPADNAEIFLRFIEEWYEPSDTAKIKEMLSLQGYLFLNNVNDKAKVIKKISRPLILIKLREYYKKEEDHIAILDAFYSKCFLNSEIKVENFPKFDEKNSPFPVNVDDGLLARNIYGRYVKDASITHIFVGDTHIYDWVNPWVGGNNLITGWRKINAIFQGKNIRMFEISINQEKKVSEEKK